jgi:CubicO group peptidase (beta-lactamase class C family)
MPEFAPVLAAVDEATRTYGAGSPDLSHLAATCDLLRRALRELERIQRAPRSGPGGGPHVKVFDGRSLVAIAERIAADTLRSAERAGVPPRRLKSAKQRVELGLKAAARGDLGGAAGHMGGGAKLAANTMVFDVERFEQNILDALAGNTVGYAFSIAWQGALYDGGRSAGLARTAADAPLLAQSPAKEMHVASVSKTLTAIVVMRLLEENGLTPGDPIAPWLPSNWAMGNSVAGLSFADFMKHESGFAQIGAGSTYDALQTAIATDVGDTTFSYSNANYGLMRVLSARLQGVDVGAVWWLPGDALTTAFFLTYAQDLFESIGVEVDCRATDPHPTIQYNLPHNDQSGYLEPDRRSACGGIGWTISANEIAAVMANLRLTENLISSEARGWMEDLSLGFMAPANYGWVVGDLGTYHMHGGDWFHGEGEAHACAVSFPIQVQVGLVINSERGGSMPYQCILLRDAFDDAWVSN